MSKTISDPWFYGDHTNDPKIRISSLAAQGLWMHMLSICAEATPKGFLTIEGKPVTSANLASIVGKPEDQVVTLLAELGSNGVFSVDSKGRIFSRRMTTKARQKQINKKNGKTGGNPMLCNKSEKPGSVNPPDNPRDKPLYPSPFPEERKKDAADAANISTSAEVELFRRGKEILGNNAGGLIRNLLSAKDGNVALARAAIEMASTKQDPREYVGAIVRGSSNTERVYGVDYW